MNYEIRYVRGHVEVYDQMGRFRFSADSCFSPGYRPGYEG